jgi:hypothetical protein
MSTAEMEGEWALAQQRASKRRRTHATADSLDVRALALAVGCADGDASVAKVQEVTITAPGKGAMVGGARRSRGMELAKDFRAVVARYRVDPPPPAPFSDDDPAFGAANDVDGVVNSTVVDRQCGEPSHQLTSLWEPGAGEVATPTWAEPALHHDDVFAREYVDAIPVGSVWLGVADVFSGFAPTHYLTPSNATREDLDPFGSTFGPPYVHAAYDGAGTTFPPAAVRPDEWDTFARDDMLT